MTTPTEIIRIFDTPCYSNYATIPIGASVSIIDKKYFDPSTYRYETGSYVKKEHESHFKNGILKKKGVLSTGAHGGTVEYTVEVDGSPIVFMSNEYYFRVFSPHYFKV